ncbi:homocitrate synthase family protein [Methanimicrococcus blatticola]|uniref:2-isopropylmalate synthase n=1 Tax=Methanimicrococcus blatticola TaxID=91560 RepID=A0A484F4D8_9EURY|nr:homocitrate synthase family protein [Methanimicrococcus blatticola]MBZ3935927.1 homocitrate synthase family protein [Methanimicrococcus blatticola]MCC2509460.1 homocitrate synthase family protein [Methanimicrococcus blatticola]TDQ68338.1 2-isopropylmalate synthase [Methanimicrococcus blatticola]
MKNQAHNEEQYPDYCRNSLMDFVKIKDIDIEICDVTLRDGEQTPGVAFSKEQKMSIAQHLDDIGVDVIEAGFPVVSDAEKDVVKSIANMGLDARICCLCRSTQKDVETAVDCDVDFVSIFLAMSDLHLKYKYHKSLDEMLDVAMNAIEYAKDHGIGVRFAAEDATRTPIPRLIDAFKMAEERNADYISVADTVGILNPITATYLVDQIYNAIDTKKTKICMHCHDDLGLAVANTLAAAEAGAFQLHTTVNGIGERAGNAALEEVLMNLRVQYGIDRYDLHTLVDLSHEVRDASKLDVAINKAVVGQNAFSHESGIHVAAILENPRTYELFLPEMVGGKRNLIVGKHTGTKALAGIIKDIGYELDEDNFTTLFDQIKIITETEQRSVERDELEKLIKNILKNN